MVPAPLYVGLNNRGKRTARKRPTCRTGPNIDQSRGLEYKLFKEVREPFSQLPTNSTTTIGVSSTDSLYSISTDRNSTDSENIIASQTASNCASVSSNVKDSQVKYNTVHYPGPQLSESESDSEESRATQTEWVPATAPVSQETLLDLEPHRPASTVEKPIEPFSEANQAVAIPDENAHQLVRQSSRSRKRSCTQKGRIEIGEGSRHNCGVGIGKGGIKRMRRIMQTQTTERAVRMSDIRRIEKKKENDLAIPRAAFHRCVKQLMHEIKPGFKMQAAALNAIQESCEGYITHFLDLSWFNTIHAGRRTLFPKDLHLTLRHMNSNLTRPIPNSHGQW